MPMEYVYILKNKRTDRTYIGYTRDLKRRFIEHKKEDNDWFTARLIMIANKLN